MTRATPAWAERWAIASAARRHAVNGMRGQHQAPGHQNGTEDAPITFSAGNGNAISASISTWMKAPA